MDAFTKPEPKKQTWHPIFNAKRGDRVSLVDADGRERAFVVMADHDPATQRMPLAGPAGGKYKLILGGDRSLYLFDARARSTMVWMTARQDVRTAHDSVCALRNKIAGRVGLQPRQVITVSDAVTDLERMLVELEIVLDGRVKEAVERARQATREAEEATAFRKSIVAQLNGMIESTLDSGSLPSETLLLRMLVKLRSWSRGWS